MPSNKKLTSRVESEAQRLALEYGYNQSVLEDFARFVLQKEPAKSQKKVKGFTLPQLKKLIYQYFQVKDTPALKQSGAFQMATTSMGNLNLSKKAAWEALYRKVIGVLPEEKNAVGYGCINGIDIFKYDLPWQTFGLDRKTAGDEDIKSAYRDLSKIYHPDIPDTGDARIFNRLTIFYKSLSERF